MSQEIEIEFKNLLTKEEFDRLCNHFSIAKEQFIPQINHYFDTPDFSLKEHKSALRIREKEGNYVLTLKQPHKIGKLETHQTLSKDEANHLIDGGTLISGEVKEIIKNFNINIDSIQFLGTLKTNRMEIDYNKGILVFDHSQYLGIDDYELEYEVTDEQEGKKQFLHLLNECNIEIKHTENKIKRFFLEKQRQEAKK